MCNNNNCKNLFSSIINLINVYKNCCLKKVDITKNKNTKYSIEKYIKEVVNKIKELFNNNDLEAKIYEITEQTNKIYVLEIVYKNIKYTVVVAKINNEIFYDTYLTPEIKELKQKLDSYVKKNIRNVSVNKKNIKKIIDEYLRRSIENEEQQNNNQNPHFNI